MVSSSPYIRNKKQWGAIGGDAINHWTARRRLVFFFLFFICIDLRYELQRKQDVDQGTGRVVDMFMGRAAFVCMNKESVCNSTVICANSLITIIKLYRINNYHN